MANKEKDPKNKKHFFKDFKAELKKVIWPTPKQLINNTVAVVVITVIIAAIVFVLDLVFDLFNNYGVNKLKAKFRNNENSIIQIDANSVVEVNNVIENSNEVLENVVQ